MKRIIILVALLASPAAHGADWTVTKTVKWSLLDRVAQALCEAERDDCDADWRCGINPAWTTCLTIGVTGSAAVWTQYRDKAQRALEATK
jgi:hypothetical protein